MTWEEDSVDLRPWIANWWRQTKNPLYAWEAIARSLNSDEPIPDWALEYLKNAANKILLLAMKQDFRRPDHRAITPAAAAKLAMQAFGLSAPRTKSAFKHRADDGKAARAAIEMDDADERVERGGRAIFYAKNGKVEPPPTPRSIKKKAGTSRGDRDRSVQRAVERGRKLNRP